MCGIVYVWIFEDDGKEATPPFRWSDDGALRDRPSFLKIHIASLGCGLILPSKSIMQERELDQTQNRMRNQTEKE